MGRQVVCYYESWAAHYFAPEDIDVSIATRINYAFLGINEDGTLRLDGTDNILRRISALKSRNRHLQLLLSVGGWSEGGATFSRVAASERAKNKMAQSILYYMQKYNFDGVDLDWEYPKRGDRDNFVDMLYTIKNHLDQDGGGLLTVAVAGVPENGNYIIPEISEIVDAINVMSYDFHGPEQGTTGHNAPLHASTSNSQWERENANCEASISNWLRGGADRRKLMLGLAFYGRTFKLSNPHHHGIGAPCSGKGMNNGHITYKEICVLNGWNYKWDNAAKVPYKYLGDQWISYDEPGSIRIKLQYAKSSNLGGVMIWAVNHDRKNSSPSLLRTIKNEQFV